VVVQHHAAVHARVVATRERGKGRGRGLRGVERTRGRGPQRHQRVIHLGVERREPVGDERRALRRPLRVDAEQLPLRHRAHDHDEQQRDRG
jgi:hypothetical protein